MCECVVGLPQAPIVGTGSLEKQWQERQLGQTRGSSSASSSPAESPQAPSPRPAAAAALRHGGRGLHAKEPVPWLERGLPACTGTWQPVAEPVEGSQGAALLASTSWERLEVYGRADEYPTCSVQDT